MSTRFNILNYVIKGIDMTYKTEKFFLSSTTNNPTAQIVSTSWIELTGSRCNITLKQNTINLLYKYSFYTYNKYVNSSNYEKTFIHVKLQKSNDDFSSNIVDLPGCQFNFSGDTEQNNDFFYKSCSPFFIVENLDSSYLRLVARSYSASNEVQIHRSNHWNSGGGADVYYNPNLLVAEL